MWAPAASEVSCEVTRDYAGTHSFGSWNEPEVEMAQPFWEICWIGLMVWKFLICSLSLLFQPTATVFCLFATWPVWRAWHSHLNVLLIGIGKLLLGPLQIQFFSRLNVSNSLGLLVGGVLQPAERHGGAPLNCLRFITFLSIRECTKSVLSFWKQRRANSISISLGEVEEDHRLLSLSHTFFRLWLLTA